MRPAVLPESGKTGKTIIMGWFVNNHAGTEVFAYIDCPNCHKQVSIEPRTMKKHKLVLIGTNLWYTYCSYKCRKCKHEWEVCFYAEAYRKWMNRIQ